MVRLDGFLRRRRGLVLVLWLLAVLASLPLAARQADNLTGGGFTAGGSESDRVAREITADYPDVGAATLAVVLVPRPGIGPTDLATAVTSSAGALAGIPGVRLDAAVVRRTAAAAREAPERPLVLPVAVDGGEGPAIDAAQLARERLGIKAGTAGRAGSGRVNVHVVGQGALWAASLEDTKAAVATAEIRGFPVIALVMLAVFGSLAAAALPLGCGVVALVITGAAIFGLSSSLAMSTFVTNIASMVGIGVAVDYSLFILARYRQEIRAGRSREQARTVAVATSGTAVVFSGITVIASMAGLFMVESTALRSMALGAMLVVALSVLVSATLLPILIGLLGQRVDEPAPWARRLRRVGGRHRLGFWPRWVAVVLRRPVLHMVAAVTVLVVLALPLFSMTIGNSAVRQLGPDHELRRGVAAVAEVAGPGALGPAVVLVTFGAGTATDPDNAAVLREVDAALSRDPGVARVEPPHRAEDGRSALVPAVLRADPESPEAHDTVDRLRAELPAVAAGDRLDVGGTTATALDFDRLVSGSLVKIMLFVLALSYVVLVLLLRSVLLPLKAVAMNVLSVAAAYGVMVAVFQWGWLSWLGLDASPAIDTATPPLVLTVAFGLSMDYEVFLLSRVRERYLATGDNRRAVSEALAESAPTITSAAVIMVVVFLAFVSAGLPSIQRLGLGCAVAVAIDATLIRLVIVPTAMERLGRWNWWLPGWLDRLLPDLGETAAGRAAVAGGRTG